MFLLKVVPLFFSEGCALFSVAGIAAAEQVDAERAKLQQDTASARESAQEAAAQLADQEAVIAAIKEQQASCNRQKQQLSNERQQALQAKVKAEADVTDATASVHAGEQSLASSCRSLTCALSKFLVIIRWNCCTS